MQVEWKMVHVLVAIATRIAVVTVILIVPCNDITLCLFVCLIYYLLFIYSFIYLLFIYLFIIYLFVNIIAFLHVSGTVYHIYVSANEQ